jgi:hypothetical protein
MDYIIDPFTNHKHSIYSNYGLNLLKKYVAYYQIGGSNQPSLAEVRAQMKAKLEERKAKSLKRYAGKAKAKATNGSGSGSKGKAKATKGSIPKLVKIIGPHICYVFKTPH